VTGTARPSSSSPAKAGEGDRARASARWRGHSASPGSTGDRITHGAKSCDQTTRFDSTEFLDSDEAISAYLEEALETDDPAFIAQALGTIARARGMSQIAKQTGLSRESLYKSLSAEGNPEFSYGSPD
jgi:probable addiction module antidote protein